MEPGISLCMIVKDEEDWIGRCLSSAKGLVEEMIVVDTGSTDSTKKVAEHHGAKVFDYKWNDNFSDARNFSISKANRKWILVLDADETISTKDADGIKSLTMNKHYDGFSFILRNYTNKTMISNFTPTPENDPYPESECWKGWDLTRCIRLFRNHPSIRFERSVHEAVDFSIQKSGGKVLQTNIPIHHQGEAKSGSQTPQKRESLYKKITENASPEDPKHNFTLGFEAFKSGDFLESISYYLKAISLEPKYLDAYIGLSQAFVAAGNLSQALDVNLDGARRFPQAHQFRYNLGEIYLALKQYENSLESYHAALRLGSPLKERIQEKINLIRSL